MKNAFQILLFFLVVIGGYTAFANSIPQIESRPPEEMAVEVSSEMTPREMANLGEDIFYGKGTCAVCHSIGQPGPRAPDLAGVGAAAGGRKPDLPAEAYLFEALLDPCAYVVEGYECIMPPVNRPPIGLARQELLAVVAFLESLGGEITPLLHEQFLEAVQSTASAPESASSTGPLLAGAGTPQEIIAQLGCGVCHTIAGVEGAEGQVGPDLSDVGARLTPDQIREAILDPNAIVAEGFLADIMPPNFGSRMTADQLETLVSFLAGLEGVP
ncbi:MAG: c-type cytochrome [Anaerolineae bacterium]